MTIEIHQPELEALIHRRMLSGAFRDVDELLTKAIGALEEQDVSASNDINAKTFSELLDSARGILTDEEVDTLFVRNPSVSRDIDFS